MFLPEYLLRSLVWSVNTSTSILAAIRFHVAFGTLVDCIQPRKLLSFPCMSQSRLSLLLCFYCKFAGWFIYIEILRCCNSAFCSVGISCRLMTEAAFYHPLANVSCKSVSHANGLRVGVEISCCSINKENYDHIVIDKRGRPRTMSSKKLSRKKGNQTSFACVSGGVCIRWMLILLSYVYLNSFFSCTFEVVEAILPVIFSASPIQILVNLYCTLAFVQGVH